MVVLKLQNTNEEIRRVIGINTGIEDSKEDYDDENPKNSPAVGGFVKSLMGKYFV